MFLYSLNGLHLAIQHSEPFKMVTERENKPLNKNLLIDKCQVVVHTIIAKNLWNLKWGNIDPIPLSKQTLSDQLGNGSYISIVKNILTHLGVIYTDGFYNAKALNPKKPSASKKYVITKEWLDKGVVQVGVLDTRTIKKFKNWKDKQYKQLLTQRKHQRILRNLSQVVFNQEEAIIRFNELESFDKDISVKDPYLKMLNYTSSFETLSKFNQYDGEKALLDDPSFYYDKSRTNRVYHYFSNVPSIYRESLHHLDGSPLIELDLKNSQPTMLLCSYMQSGSLKRPTYIGRLYKEMKERYREIDRYISGSFRPSEDIFLEEYPKLAKAIFNGDLYQAVAEHALKQGDFEYYDLYKSNRGKFKQEIIAYGLFNKMLPLQKVHKAEGYLLEMLPLFMNWIRLEKLKYGYKHIPYLAQSLEASIFIDGVFGKLQDHSFGFAIPIHDSLIVKESEEEYWREQLYQAFLEVFPMKHILNKSRLESIIKTKHYTHNND